MKKFRVPYPDVIMNLIDPPASREGHEEHNTAAARWPGGADPRILGSTMFAADV